MKKYLFSFIALLFLSINCYATYDWSLGGQKFDTDTKGLITIDSSLDQIHEGNMWTVGASTTALTNGSTATFLINLTSATITKELHIIFNAAVSSQVSVSLYEDCQYTSSGTAITAYNMNRSSNVACQAGIIFSANATQLITLGTTLSTQLIPNVGTSIQTNNGDRKSNEWILKAGKAYCIVITNSSGGNIALNLNLQFYEVD